MSDEVLASDPTTSEATLRKLASRGVPALRERIASNPSTPLDVLLGLVKSHGAAVLGNPSFSRALCEDSTLFDRLSSAARVALARLPALSPEWAWELARRGTAKERRVLAAEGPLPPELREVLSRDTDPEVQSAVLTRTDAPPALANLIAKARAGIAKNTTRLDADEIAWLVLAGPWTRWLVSQQADLSPEIAWELLATNEALSLSGLASSHGKRLWWDDATVEKFLEHGHGGALVGNPCISPRRWAEILPRRLDLLGDVLRTLAPSPELIFGLVHSDSERLRRELAANPMTPSWGLKELCRDPCPELRQRLAVNPRLPADAIPLLAADPDEGVRATVAAMLRSPPHVLDVLSQDPVPRVRQRVAANPGTPPDTLLSLATDPDMAVRIVVARHPALPQGALANLAADDDLDVRNQAAAVLRGDAQYPAWTPACLGAAPPASLTRYPGSQA